MAKANDPISWLYGLFHVSKIEMHEASSHCRVYCGSMVETVANTKDSNELSAETNRCNSFVNMQSMRAK